MVNRSTNILPYGARSGGTGRSSNALIIKNEHAPHGFGLFDLTDEDDDDDDEDAAGDQVSFSFSGNPGGFGETDFRGGSSKRKGKGKGLADVDEGDDEEDLSPVLTPILKKYSVPTPKPEYPKFNNTPTTSRSSRTSKLVTPTARANRSHRSTPYSTTASRALQRAKRVRGASDDDNQLISDVSFEIPKDPYTPKYAMRGAKESPGELEDEEETEEMEEIEGDGTPSSTKSTPSRNIFSRTSTPTKASPKTPTTGKPPATTPGRKTWGEWLSNVLPQSVRKPVKALIGTPANDNVKDGKPLMPKTPKPETDDEDEDMEPAMPGSFGKSKKSKRSKSVGGALRHKGESGAEGRRNHNNPPQPSVSASASKGMFTYNKPVISPTTKLVAPSRRARALSMSTPAKSSARAKSSTPMSVTSKPRPSNFLERMRSAKKSHRYDPYARPSKNTPKKVIAKKDEEMEEMGTELSAEEQLDLLERRERDRKVQEAEDRYLRREMLRKLGRPMEEDDDTPAKPNDLQATVEDTSDHEEMAVDKPETATPIKKSPPKSVQKEEEAPKTPPQNAFEATPSKSTSPLLGFLFTDASPPQSPNGPLAEATNTNTPPPASWSFSSDSDKENISSGPPPPPTMSHAQLPAPFATSSQPPQLSGGSSLFATSPHQPIGGFGLAPAVKESPAIGRQRSAAEKFKPHVSSGLRESSTIDRDEEKENEIGSNGEDRIMKGTSEEKQKKREQSPKKQYTPYTPFKPQAPTTQPPQPSPQPPALKEKDVNMIGGFNKVDVKITVEAISTDKFEYPCIFQTDSNFGTQHIKEAVSRMWNTTLVRGGGEFENGFRDMFTVVA